MLIVPVCRPGGPLQVHWQVQVRVQVCAITGSTGMPVMMIGGPGGPAARQRRDSGAAGGPGLRLRVIQRCCQCCQSE